MTHDEIKNLTVYDPVTYVPNHANGNAQHVDAELGVFIGWVRADVIDTARVLYCKSRTIQRTNINDLVLG